MEKVSKTNIEDPVQATNSENPLQGNMQMLLYLRKVGEKAIASKWVAYRKANSNALKGGIVFAGDSITEGYPIYEMFPRNLQLYNRGVSGITSAQLLQNLDAHVLELAPEKLFLLIGTNDLGLNATVKEAAENIRIICEKVRQTCPETEIFVISIYPIDASKHENVFAGAPNNRTDETILELNQLVQKNISNISRVVYLDAHSTLKTAEGKIKPEYTGDGLHLTYEGYQQVTKFLTPYVL